MYTIALLLYGFILHIAALFNKKAKLLVTGQKQTFKILKEKLEPGANYIWFHAASLGEFEQGRVLMEKIKKLHPEYKLILTFFSPSGYEVRKNYEGADIVCYLPLDTFFNAERFINMVQPKMVFFIKYEFWANFMYKIKHRNIPFYSVSSIFRPNQAFFKWYGIMYRYTLGCFTQIFVQDENSKRLLNARGINNISIVGDTRFDRVLEIKNNAPDIPLVATFANQKPQDGYIMIVGSSWPPDEDIAISYFNQHKEQLLILAPHVVSESHLKEIEQKLQRPSLRFSQANEENIKNAECLIIDCYGKLSSIYRYGQTAYIGGGFGVGIHNVPEAAVYGIPTIVGPNNKNFREVQKMLTLGATFEIRNTQDYNTLMDKFAASPAFHQQAGEKANAFINAEKGATDKIYNAIFNQ